MTTPLERVFADFADAWSAGGRPDVTDYLARVPEAQRDELAERIELWLTLAPTPDYDDATLAQIRAEPVVQSALAAHRITRAREAAALDTYAVADAVVEELGLAPAHREKTGRLLRALEGGRLDPGGLSQRLVDALSRILRAPAEAFAAQARGTRPAAAPMAFRADSEAYADAAEDLELLRRGAEAPGGADWDEVDELFRGGR